MSIIKFEGNFFPGTNISNLFVDDKVLFRGALTRLDWELICHKSITIRLLERLEYDRTSNNTKSCSNVTANASNQEVGCINSRALPGLAGMPRGRAILAKACRYAAAVQLTCTAVYLDPAVSHPPGHAGIAEVHALSGTHKEALDTPFFDRIVSLDHFTSYPFATDRLTFELSLEIDYCNSI